MTETITIDFARIAQDLQIRKVQVASVVQLLDEGNTVPFITRYRKERTGGLNEDFIRKIQSRVLQQRQLADRKQTILKSIEGQGKLTDDLRQAILEADTSKRLEDLYLPYKPRKRTLANAARERGLEPLALSIWNRDPAVANLDEVLPGMVNAEKELPTTVEVLLGVQHILADLIADDADVRAAVRIVLWDTGKLCTAKSETLPEGQGLDFKDYFEFSEPIRQIPPHRILAINRGEKEGPLKVSLQWDAEAVTRVLNEPRRDKPPLLNFADHPHGAFLKTVADDALARLLLPSLEREIRRELSERAQEHAVEVFARNLRSLLLQPPLRGKRVLGIDPGFRTGCKVAALDETGNLLEEAVVFPHPPQKKKEEAKAKLKELIRKHQMQVIAIGNGTACRETEEIVSEVIADWPNIRSVATVQAIAKAAAAARAQAAAAKRAEAAAAAAAAQAAAAAAAPVAGEPAAATDPAGASPQPAAEQAAVAAEQAAQVAAAPSEAQGEVPPPELVPPESAEQTTATEPMPAEPVPAAEASQPEAPPEPEPSPDEPVPDLAYVIVNEAGASVYSASPTGREEFPNFDATLRGTISIGRRLQDPLSELVKIDPQNIGVGLYQHDVNPKQLKESLESVVESCVNHVGVNLNTASVSLLRHVSGLNHLVARELVDYRTQHGVFKSRDQLLHVPSVGPARFTQAAGFLTIGESENPLDCTTIHPESYEPARKILEDMGYAPDALLDRDKLGELRTKIQAVSPQEISVRLGVGLPTVVDILDALARPGYDPRDDLPPPVFKKGILKLEDLQAGMELKGTVLNVVDFGAFVDIGLKDSGLVHISQMANRYIKNPYDLISVGDVVTVWVMNLDLERRRVSLTMIKPGTERAPAEKKAEPRPPRAERPPRREPVKVTPPPPKRDRPLTIIPPKQVAEAAAAAAASAAANAEASAKGPAAPPPRRQITVTPPKPQKPQRKPPKPKLSQAALEGDAPLRSLGELAAFFEAKKKPEPPPAATEAVAEAPADNQPSTPQ